MNSKCDHVHVLSNKLEVPLFNNYPYKWVPKNPVDIVSRLTCCRPAWPPRCRLARSRWGRCTSATSPAASAPAPPRRWGTDQSEPSIATTLHQSQLTWLAWMWVSISPGIRNWDGDNCRTSAAATSCLRVATSGSWFTFIYFITPTSQEHCPGLHREPFLWFCRHKSLEHPPPPSGSSLHCSPPTVLKISHLREKRKEKIKQLVFANLSARWRTLWRLYSR